MPRPKLEHVDCVVIGGGPAGLTAAVYLSRYRRNVIVFDDGHSRARLIPESHNYPGFSGIAGLELLNTLRRQARRYGARIEHHRVDTLELENGTFTASSETKQIRSSYVLLATGIIDESPHLPGLRNIIHEGEIRFCPICDGYEAMDRRIGVLGQLETAWRKALFLRTYSKNVVLLATDGLDAATTEMRKALHEAGIAMPSHAVSDVVRTGETITALLANGERCAVDVLYPAMGCEVRSRLGTTLGARAGQNGCLIVDEHRCTSVPGLYAAGDVVSDLHQISVGTGHAAVAATAIHNRLPHNYR